MKKISILLLSLIYVGFANAQYTFTEKNKIKCTAVKSQDKTGTCWSFATSSFVESELMRQHSNQSYDLSEMYIVRKIYEDKAQNYMLRQGKANFSQGSLAHDMLRIAAIHGTIPESAYSGKAQGEAKHDHGELESAIKGYLDGVLKSKRKSNRWRKGVSALLDIYLGEVPLQFTYKGMTYKPADFSQKYRLDLDNYVHITSFSHHPFYDRFILELPDNYSNGSYFNLPINELQNAVDHAIQNGYSVAWDGDVSEDGFDARKGLAVLPEQGVEAYFENPSKEKLVTQQNRQEAFENFSTTDDHLMHIVGISHDQKGNKYYLIKNSWGEISDYKGYLYMSEAYFKMKTVSVSLHKEGLPKKTSKYFAGM